MWVWEAFTILSSTRRVDGFAGAQPIGVVDVDAYARLRGLADDDAEELLDLVLAMDRIFMVWARKQQEHRSREIGQQRPKQKRPSFG